MMAKLIDFKCQYADFRGVTPEYAASLGLKLPDLYLNAEDMVKLALKIKEDNNSSFCKLPLDTCVQAENLGGKIKYDDSPLGPRKDIDILNDTEEVLNLPAIDPSKGRMAELLKACQMLIEQGETVALEIRGIFDMLNSLMDIQKVFMTCAMKQDVMKKVCDRIRSDVVTYFLAAEKIGCNLFFYSDSSGGVNIIGPRFGKKMVEWFTYPLMKELSEVLSEKTIVHMCPKVSFMLVGSGKAKWKAEEIPEETDYLSAYKNNPNVRFTGQRCNKELNQTTKNKIYHLIIE
ncbi:uroporphyrinogen decarboxylase family protein [Anaerovorax sp. IOR16]|uniref:uroporphyrinogen decarboxylase family protein n=1 Tax=Anaerovorax sp. IOR16 TaxID=2773458 RepID=UPI0019CF71C9|nr:uroporphyrinogen decarboxylase family protein [Anaerovorax sp. IOR16]